MPRPRQHNRHLPRSVYLRHGTYYLVRAGQWTPLGRDLASALREHARLVNADAGTDVGSLIRVALAERHKQRQLAESTREQYAIIAESLAEMLAEFRPEQVERRHVAAIKAALADRPNWANRHLTVLHIAFSYAADAGIVATDPTIGVTKFREQERERLLTLDEYHAIRAQAGARLQAIMDLCLLTAQRISDVLSIRLADLTDEGIAFRQGKTGHRLVVGWSEALRAAVDRARALPGSVRSLMLLQARHGQPLKYRTVLHQWAQACELAGVGDARPHDLRAMAATMADEQGLDAKRLLGHKSESTTARYLRSKKIPTVTGPVLADFGGSGGKAEVLPMKSKVR